MKLNSVTPAFSSPILSFTLPDAIELNQQLISEAEAMRATSKGVVRSNQQGWHSESDLFARKEEGIKKLCGHIIKAFNTATKKVAPEFPFANHVMQFEGWININPQGACNTPHDHPGYVWSGCYYVNQPAVNKGRSGMIEFIDPRLGLRDQSVLSATTFSPKYQMRPAAGTLLLFPSYLFHWVYPNERNDERVTIAWNGRYVKKKTTSEKAAS